MSNETQYTTAEHAANAVLARLEPSFGEWSDKDDAVAEIIATAYTPVLAKLERENAELRAALTMVQDNIVTFQDPTKMPCAYLSPAEVEVVRAALR